MIAWRLSAKRRARDMSGIGAAKSGGRWNRKDVAVLYLGLTPAICCLERFVHANGAPSEPLAMTRFRLPGDAALYWEPSLAELPAGWNALPADKRSWDFGNQWLEAGKHLGLIVPSVVVPMERNIVINPTHPQARDIQIETVADFAFDDRMLELLKTAD